MTARENVYGFAQRRIDSVREVTLIEVATTEGAGTGDDVVHRHSRFFNAAGELVAETPSQKCGHGLDYEHYIDSETDRRICHPPNCSACNSFPPIAVSGGNT